MGFANNSEAHLDLLGRQTDRCSSEVFCQIVIDVFENQHQSHFSERTTSMADVKQPEIQFIETKNQLVQLNETYLTTC
jgi:hypothetical protein